MNKLELELLIALVRKEQHLIYIARELFAEHRKTEGAHGMNDCRLCGLFYHNDDPVEVGGE